MKENNIIKIDGTNIFILDDLIYLDNENYIHFFKIEDAFNYYKRIGQSLNKKVAFNFFDYELLIDENTTLEDLNKQIEIQKQVIAKNNKKDEKIINYNVERFMYESYILINNDVRFKISNFRIKDKNIKVNIKK